ncbi:hypothetical protein [Rosenbergiella collisarenosi]|uniref:DUF7878 domain-containing protein n=1 Tax=Rosenbergiella collisarenosi TaxID=1544695 RepID=UPI001F4F493A|nr:hypothetical protein [Rosenbergiella collisarenosi]
MECIPSESSIVIDYSNMYIREIHPTNQIYCEVEGALTISKWNECIFSEKNILLLEFAKALNTWSKQPDLDFEYYSMDYEEGPIVYFRHETSQICSVGGIWLEGVCYEVESVELILACNAFIRNILNDLISRGVDIDLLF